MRFGRIGPLQVHWRHLWRHLWVRVRRCCCAVCWSSCSSLTCLPRPFYTWHSILIILLALFGVWGRCFKYPFFFLSAVLLTAANWLSLLSLSLSLSLLAPSQKTTAKHQHQQQQQQQYSFMNHKKALFLVGCRFLGPCARCSSLDECVSRTAFRFSSVCACVSSLVASSFAFTQTHESSKSSTNNILMILFVDIDFLLFVVFDFDF